MDHCNELTGLEIAIIGMAARLPGADNIEEFWNNLAAGIESLAIDEERGGVIEDKEYFDPSFFNMTPTEAQLMNPQTRLLCQCCWHSLEDAGYDPLSTESIIGIYAGASSGFAWQGMVTFSAEASAVGNFEAGLLADVNYLCTRIAYLLNLRGPSILVQSACSTSLVAVHLACQGLLNAECDLALAGGATILAADEGGYFSREGAITSPDGHCRAFDKDAAGMVRGEGAGVLVLKRYDQAVVDRDHVYALIKGTAVNNDGNRKVGFAAPSVNGQAESISIAMQMAEVEPESISYIEAHGTGTKLGDPVEVEGLKRAFAVEKRGFCGIGSVKTNIGHLDAAAGVAGLIKTVLAMAHRKIPPSLHFKHPNPEIDFAASPFYVVDRLIDWDVELPPRRAGISSFGIGGTNGHIIVEEALSTQSDVSATDSPRSWQLIPLSAQDEQALDAASERLTRYFQSHPAANLADAAFTLSVGRRAFKNRRFLVCRDVDEAVEGFSSAGPRRPSSEQIPREKPSVVFVFPGLGAQYPGMGKELYESEPVFRDEMDRCFDFLQRSFAIRLKPIVYPARENPGDSPVITDIALSQLAVFCLEYSLASLLKSWGLQPDAVIGYSFGELTAACVSGAWSRENILRLVVKRGEAMSRIAEGAMLSVPLPVKDVQDILPAELSIAIDNGPSCIVAGPETAIVSFESVIKGKRCLPVRLPATHAVHSPMMKDAAPEIGRLAASMPGKCPVIPMVSNVTGAWLTETETRDPDYWQRQLLNRVQFADGVHLLLEEENTVFVEVGPGSDLTALLAAYIETVPQAKAINLMPRQEQDVSETHYLLNKIGHLWLRGIQPDWSAFYQGQARNRISLPVYPFQRQRYWIKPDFGKLSDAGFSRGDEGFDHWFYLPSWIYSPIKTVPEVSADGAESLLLFASQSPAGEKIRDRWKRKGHPVVSVRIGNQLTLDSGEEVTIDPANKDHYTRLLAHLRVRGRFPLRIVHAWNLEDRHFQTDSGAIEDSMEEGFYSLLYLVQALASEELPHTLHLDVVGRRLYDVSGADPVNPAMSAMTGLMKVIPQEYPQLRCRCIDVALPENDTKGYDAAIQPLIKELANPQHEPVVAFRGLRRWVERPEAFPLSPPQNDDIPVRPGGRYLITGGLGDIGFILSRYLLEEYSASLVLTGRSSATERSDSESNAIRWRRLEQLRAIGGRVRYEPLDVADDNGMEYLISAVEAEWGAIHGVFHLAGIGKEDLFLPLDQVDAQVCQDHFRAKVSGTRALQNVFKNRSLDFCWMMSSISTLLGGLRFGVYAAANSVMEAMIHDMHRGFGQWICAAWDGIDEEKTVEAFRRILSLRGIPRVLVSNFGRLDERYRQWVLLEDLHSQADLQPEAVEVTHPRPALVTNYIAPENQTQKELVNIWEQLFGFAPIGIDDDFMELGGGSLKAITVISHIHSRMQKEVPLAEFFRRPTVRQLAGFLRQAERVQYTDIQATEKKEYYPLSSAQKRLFILQQRDLESTAYNLPTVMVLNRDPGEAVVESIFENLTARHESLRTSFVILNGQPFQKIEDVAPLGIKRFDLSSEPLEGDRVRRILKKFVCPIDLTQAPAFHLGLLKIPGEQGILLLDMHHIITDGVSNEILLEEFMALLNGHSLPAIQLQYKDYSQWQLHSADFGELQKQRDYWLSQYMSPAPTLNLPLDFPRPPLQSFEGDHVSLIFERDLTERLEQQARESGATLYMILLAVYKVLLSLYTRQEDLVVGSPITGRRHEELQPIIGLFVNMLAIRSFPAGEKTFLQFLSEVRDSVLGAMENQEYQYYDLVAELGLQGDRSRNPLFSAVLAMQNIAPEREPSLPTNGNQAGDLDQVGIEVNIAKFDLLLNVVENPDGLDLNVEYASRLFKKSTIMAIGRHLEEVARQALETPDILLRDIRLSTAQENIQTGNLSGFGDDFGF